MSEQYDGIKELVKATAEIGAVGTLATVATSAPASSIALVTVATVGATPIAVSLVGVTAVSASAAIGFSLGKRIVKALNHTGEKNSSSDTRSQTT
jgi:uncharacterized protein (DUF697 family)